jgi:hypothetical protein
MPYSESLMTLKSFCCHDIAHYACSSQGLTINVVTKKFSLSFKSFLSLHFYWIVSSPANLARNIGRNATQEIHWYILFSRNTSADSRPNTTAASFPSQKNNIVQVFVIGAVPGTKTAVLCE